MADPHLPHNNITVDLSPDIVYFHLLPRLPVKSLLRFTCVSKEWHSLLTPTFAKMHLHNLTNNHNQNHQKLLLLSTTKPYTFRTINCETPQYESTPIRPLPFEVGHGQNISIVASLHGMLCVGITSPPPNAWTPNSLKICDLLLWNPVTGDYKILSKPRFYKECYQTVGCPFGLYYSSTEDDYKLLCLTHHPNVYYIYSLKSDSWRKFGSRLDSQDSDTFWDPSTWKPSAFLDDKLYFLKPVYLGMARVSYTIMRFNTKTNKSKKITIPRFQNELKHCFGFMAVKGSIHLCVATKNGTDVWSIIFELWRMQGNGRWRKVVTFSRKKPSTWRGQQPLHIMRNGNWLMCSKVDQCNPYLYELDMEKHTKDMFPKDITQGMEVCLGGKYIETMVSPNQYMK